ncbi:MAG: bifunctional (p)ppGpp synthetase/guanosine-3',5'-bis(diphosphate) 3'-pyrophosphohydrolase [Parcubacteria group bacterium]|nr:bifunctional (p)ppGpp synthetase/guanosine-3',5'-bis(diphosphate) 3'-pyrophosphohydrolase [Parcubacteria group bacterium]
MTIDSLLRKIKKNSPQADAAKIREAYNFALTRHGEQLRKTGEAYIQHPLYVASFLAQFNFNTATFVAALLHDVAEDTSTKLETIEKRFGSEVVLLVRGLTKLKKIKGGLSDASLQDYSAENLRKMFLATAADIRVVLIKLADRLHNIQTLTGLLPTKRKRIARETIEIYAPLANRLGMGELKGQLEDYAFPFLYPRAYQRTKALYEQEIEKKKKYVGKVKRQVASKLAEEGMKQVDIHGRAKYLYSLYKKLRRHDYDINEIYDLVAIRIIVQTVPDCYKVLGIIHKNWKPLLGRIKDYIAVPKANGYRSLHTSTIGPDGEVVEFQIRTADMHEEAEYGIAAHWHYSEKEKPRTGSKAPADVIKWVNQLVKWQQEITTKEPGEKYLESLKIDIFKDRIFVFTPRGQVYDLPEGASPIDFAFHVHTDIGNHCRAAKINGKLTSLDSELKNGDRVEIITDDKATPSLDWLDFAKTSVAQNKIKKWFKNLDRQQNIELGRRLLNSQLLQLKNKNIESLPRHKVDATLKKYNTNTIEDLFVKIAEGDLRAKNIIKYIYREQDLLHTTPTSRFSIFNQAGQKPIARVQGESGLLTFYAKCCHPTINDPIKAHITRSRGARIHRADCPELKKKKRGRVVNASWKEKYIGQVKIEIEMADRVGLLKDVIQTVSQKNVNIVDSRTRVNVRADTTVITITMEIKNIDQLFTLLNEIRKIEGVKKVRRRN